MRTTCMKNHGWVILSLSQIDIDRKRYCHVNVEWYGALKHFILLKTSHTINFSDHICIVMNYTQRRSVALSVLIIALRQLGSLTFQVALWWFCTCFYFWKDQSNSKTRSNHNRMIIVNTVMSETICKTLLKDKCTPVNNSTTVASTKLTWTNMIVMRRAYYRNTYTIGPVGQRLNFECTSSKFCA